MIIFLNITIIGLTNTVSHLKVTFSIHFHSLTIEVANDIEILVKYIVNDYYSKDFLRNYTKHVKL